MLLVSIRIAEAILRYIIYIFIIGYEYYPEFFVR